MANKLEDILRAGSGGDADIIDIIRERLRHPGEQQFQNAASLADHQAFARDVMQSAPWYLKPVRAAGLAFAIPGYELKKALGLVDRDQYTSDASLGSIGAGYRGLWEGL